MYIIPWPGYVASVHTWYGARLPQQLRVINELEGLLSSALSFIGVVHIGARALHVLNLIWFGTGNFLVQMIFTCRRYVQRKGGRSAPCVQQMDLPFVPVRVASASSEVSPGRTDIAILSPFHIIDPI
jgi:hypothetical protein